jgi:phage gp29-like protein
VTPQYIESALRGAYGGSHIQAWELFDLMEDTWPRLGKCLNELKRAVIQLDWKLEPWAEEDMPPTSNAVERKRLVSAACWKMNPDPMEGGNDFHGTMYDILDGWAKGMSVLEIVWEMRRAGPLGDITAPKATQWIRPDNYAWTTDGRLGLTKEALDPKTREKRGYTMGQTATTFLPCGLETVDFPDDKFIIAIARHKTGHPLTAALLRPLAWWWCAQNFSADWLMNLAQIFGLPFRWGTHQEGAPAETIDRICNMMQNMGSAGWGVFPEGTNLNFLSASSLGTMSPQADLMERADKNCELLVLGQTLTSDTGDTGGGSYALGKVHQGVKEANVLAAANYVACVLNSQLTPPILRQNYGDTDEAPEWRPEFKRQQDELADANRDAVLLKSGIELPKKWFYQRHNVPLPQEGEETLGGENEAGTGGMADRPSGEPADKGEGDDEEKEDMEAANRSPSSATEYFVRAVAADMQPVRQRLSAILSISDAALMRDKLEEFVRDVDRMKRDLKADPESARALDQIQSAAMVNL